MLDVGLPDIDGLDVCRLLRREGNRVPVLMLTARDAVADRIDGLDAGADDYLVKPFDIDELKARLRALLRRARRRERTPRAGCRSASCAWTQRAMESSWARTSPSSPGRSTSCWS